MGQPYTRPVYYYETDQMHIVHHANYIRWMEEARIAYMHDIGVDYRQMEDEGIIMPVTDVSCSYRRSLLFGQRLCVSVRITAFNGVRMSFAYEIRAEGDDQIAAQGTSGHCFLDSKTHRPISLKHRCAASYEQVLSLLSAEGASV